MCSTYGMKSKVAISFTKKDGGRDNGIFSPNPFFFPFGQLVNGSSQLCEV